MSHETPDPTPSTPVSPKVSYGAVTGLLAAIVAAVLGGLVINPDALGVELPTWVTFLLLTGAPVVVQAATAYAKRDPLRDAGARHRLEG